MGQALRHILAFVVLWEVPLSLALVVPQPWGALGGVAVFVWFLRAYVLRTGLPGEVRRWALLRLRPLRGDALRATLAAIPTLFLLSWSLGEVWLRLVPVSPKWLRPFETLDDTPAERLAVVLAALVAAPLLEELVFRGMVQHPLERRWGPARAILFTASVFALAHLAIPVFPLYLLLGVAFGFTVYATRSVWAGVLLHAANNSLAAFGLGAAEAPELPPTVWKTGATPEFWTALAVLALASLLAFRVGRWMWRAGHASRSPA